MRFHASVAKHEHIDASMRLPCASRRKSSLAEELRAALPKKTEMPPSFATVVTALLGVLVGVKARTPDAVRTELGKWRREHLEGLADADVVGLCFEELLPNALSEYLVLKERTKVFDAATLINTVLFTWGDTSRTSS